jgi:hypothetical protein
MQRLNSVCKPVCQRLLFERYNGLLVSTHDFFIVMQQEQREAGYQFDPMDYMTIIKFAARLTACTKLKEAQMIAEEYQLSIGVQNEQYVL